MTWELHHHNALHVSELLAPESVDLIITSPPYFALRSYRDDGEHYDGQLGSEATPTEFVDALVACVADWVKVLRPGGSIFVNLGDKYAGSGGHNNNGLGSTTLHTAGAARSAKNADVSYENKSRATRRNAPDRYNQNSDGIRPKSLMGLPWRFALRCIDDLDLILRAEIIWSKPNGLPESVTDRVRRSHEQWFHFVREPRYFAAIDEVREEYAPAYVEWMDAKPPGGWQRGRVYSERGDKGIANADALHPLGKVPGSVWTVPAEPLHVPDHLGVDHFAAFPTEWPRRLILGWSPSGYCTACDQPRQAVVDTCYRSTVRYDSAHDGKPDTGRHANPSWGSSSDPPSTHTITGYSCACPDTTAPTRPAVILDPFTGTGTVPMVAHHLGRHGIGIDLSKDYLRLAEWRCSSDVRARSKVRARSGIPDPAPPKVDGQLGLFGEVDA